MTHEIEALLNEVRLLYQRIIEIGEQLHGDESVTMGMRAVLEYLLKNGSSTVPEIARSRSVTRQHIQMLANDLLKRNFVQLKDNPLHKRSALLTLTGEGKRIINWMRERERQLYLNTTFGVSREELEAAAIVLGRVRAALK